LRLFLATLVIVSHSFEIIDGDRDREPLTRLFHTLSLGDLAVNGFFVLSGFLIVQSWQRNPQLVRFLQNRVRRIHPGFIVASLVCGLVVGPLGADPSRYFAEFKFFRFFGSMLILRSPIIPPVFAGTPDPVVNGSLWTIPYEFRCYCLVALLGLVGLVGRRRLWLVFSLAALGISVVARSLPALPGHIQFLAGDPAHLSRFIAYFCAGGCFCLFRDRILYRPWLAVVATLLVLPCLFRTETAQVALVTLGAYAFLTVAFADIPVVERFRTYPDISYGVYLYAWPVQKLLLWYFPLLSPWELFGLAFVASSVCGLLSWHLVEGPCLGAKRKLSERPAGERVRQSDLSPAEVPSAERASQESGEPCPQVG
jgi:peptidoglycan/LPS O-acetylase OafA/YrhL